MQEAQQADLEIMAALAQPLDEWCDFCTTKLAVTKTDEGTPMCDECAAQVRAAMARYAEEAREAALPPRPKDPSRSAQKAKARAKRRAKRKRTRR